MSGASSGATSVKICDKSAIVFSSLLGVVAGCDSVPNNELFDIAGNFEER